MATPALDLLITELHQRFTPAVGILDSGRSAFADSHCPPAIGSVPLPPPELQVLHDAQFVESLWQCVDALLSQPTIALTLRSGARAVQVLGVAVFVRGPSGQLHTFLWENAYSLEWATPRTVMVTEIPHGSIWLRRLVWQALHRKFNLPNGQDPVDRDSNEAYGEWLLKLLQRRIRHHHDLRGVRQRIAQALCIDVQAWRLCHHLHIGSPMDSKASVSQYNLCVRHKPELLEMEAVAPRALGIYALLCEQPDFPRTGEPTQRLRGYLRKCGCSARVWRLVLCNGSRLLLLVRQFYGPCGAWAVLDCLRVMDGLGVTQVPPVWLTQSLFGEWGNAAARRSSYLDPMERCMPNLRHVVSCAQATFTVCPDDAQEEQIAEVVHWISEPHTKRLTRTQRQGGWAYLAREARRYLQLREENEMALGLSWETPFDTLDAGGLRLVALANSMQLLEEGRRMRNCAFARKQHCSMGYELLVSARNLAGKRIATASYEYMGDAWCLKDAKGPMNRALDSRLMQCLKDAAALMPVDAGAESAQRAINEEMAPDPVVQILKALNGGNP